MPHYRFNLISHATANFLETVDYEMSNILVLRILFCGRPDPRGW